MLHPSDKPRTTTGPASTNQQPRLTLTFPSAAGQLALPDKHATAIAELPPESQQSLQKLLDTVTPLCCDYSTPAPHISTPMWICAGNFSPEGRCLMDVMDALLAKFKLSDAKVAAGSWFEPSASGRFDVIAFNSNCKSQLKTFGDHVRLATTLAIHKFEPVSPKYKWNDISLRVRQLGALATAGLLYLTPVAAAMTYFVDSQAAIRAPVLETMVYLGLLASGSILCFIAASESLRRSIVLGAGRTNLRLASHRA